MYISTINHTSIHKSSKPHLSPQEREYVISNIQYSPSIVANQMMNNGLFPSTLLGAKRKLINTLLYNMRRATRKKCEQEWNMEAAVQCMDLFQIDIDKIEMSSFLNRLVNDQYHMMRNIIIIDHDLNLKDKWTYILFTVKSAINVNFLRLCRYYAR